MTTSFIGFLGQNPHNDFYSHTGIWIFQDGIQTCKTYSKPSHFWLLDAFTGNHLLSSLILKFQLKCQPLQKEFYDLNNYMQAIAIFYLAILIYFIIYFTMLCMYILFVLWLSSLFEIIILLLSWWFITSLHS